MNRTCIASAGLLNGGIGMTDEIQSNLDVVLFVLDGLGGATVKVPTERIAFESARLAPDRFCWVMQEYRHFPDKDVARIALEDAAKTKYGQLVQGKHAREQSRDGWVLTPSGVRWLKSNRERIAAALSHDERDVHRLSPIEDKRFRSRMNRDRAFQRFSKTGTLEDVSWYMLADLLQVSPDSPADILNRKFNHLLATAELINDKPIISFLQACRDRFADFIDSPQEDDND